LFFSSAGGEIPALEFQQNPVYGRLNLDSQREDNFDAVWPVIGTPDVQGGKIRLREDSTLNHLPPIRDRPDRGKVPLMWCISPVLAERVPMALDYRRETATKNDYFAAADNGAGYLMPGMLQEPRPVFSLFSILFILQFFLPPSFPVSSVETVIHPVSTAGLS
jgi:hypothetical protein